ncbi:HlyD family secretion protein [Methylocella sp.]|uniref:HlyD family secretion protein n=1 Tax=Methylocella sp. TaxID=1978226 RepID=UPI0037836D98
MTASGDGAEDHGAPPVHEREAEVPPAKAAERTTSAARGPAIIVALIVATIVGLSLWYLAQPQPLVIQGEAAATRIDIAARVEGRVGRRPVSRGENVAAAQLLVEIDNPQLLTKFKEMEAALDVAKAELARVEVGTRAEVVAQRKAAVDSAHADLVLAQKIYDRIKELASHGNATLQRLDEATNSLLVSQRASDQARLSYEEAIAGHTREERDVARANVEKARASLETIRAQVDELEVKAPIGGQVYQIGAEVGEYVAPGAPLLSLVDLGDVWLRFDLREDLVAQLKVGDRFEMRAPALGDRKIVAEIKVIATKGEYAGWRATRATGDFDLRTFEVRAYPATPVPELRPGMSVYAQAPAGRR